MDWAVIMNIFILDVHSRNCITMSSWGCEPTLLEAQSNWSKKNILNRQKWSCRVRLILSLWLKVLLWCWKLVYIIFGMRLKVSSLQKNPTVYETEAHQLLVHWSLLSKDNKCSSFSQHNVIFKKCAHTQIPPPLIKANFFHFSNWATPPPTCSN